MCTIRFHFLTLFCLLTYTASSAQNIDSLLRVQDQATTVMEKYEAEKILIEAYKQTRQFDKVPPHLDNLLQAAQKIENTSYKVEAYLLASRFAFIQGELVQADSLYVLALASATTKEQKFQIYQGRIDTKLQSGAIEKIPIYLQKMRECIVDTTSSLMIEYYKYKGLYYGRQHDHVNQLIWLQKAKKLAKEQDSRIIPSINQHLSIIYEELNAYDQSLSIALENQALAQKNKHLLLELFSYFGIMSNYYKLKEYQKVKDYGYKAIDFKNRTGKMNAFGYVYYILGSTHLKEAQLDSAEYYFKKGLDISEKQNASKELGDNHEGLCELYYLKRDLEKAQFHGEEAMKRFNYTDTDLNHYLGKIYAAKGNYKRAYERLSVNQKEWIQREENRQYYTIINSLLNEKFANEIEVLRKDKELQALTIRNQNYLVVISLILIVMFGSIGFFFWKQHQYRKALTESQKTIIEQERQTNKMKTQFFSNVSHELRTPLSLILGNLDLISKDERIQNGALTAVKKAKQQSQEMLDLVDIILDISRKDVVEIIPKPQLFLVREFTAFIADKVRPLAKRKEIAFVSNSVVAASTVFAVDVDMLTTIIKNLLENAFKYTHLGGKVSIAYQLEDNQLKVYVSDSGRGIPTADLPYIFDRYYQVEGGEYKAEGGFGIGLSICKDYVDALGGTIEVESEVGEYTRFSISIPSTKATIDRGNLYQFKSVEPIQSSVQSELLSESGIEDDEFILIVEDNIEMCDYLNTLLSREYNLVFAHHGMEALRILERHRPMLIITDLMMPMMDGMTMIEQFKENKREANIPIIILTAKDNVLDEIKAARFGVEEFLRKPFGEEELKAHIYYLLHLEDQRVEFLKEMPAAEDYVGQLKNSKLKTSKEHQVSHSNEEWVRKVEEKISPLITDMDLNIDKICEELEISPSHLTRQMKTLMGMTPKRYINELRLLMGRRMLENKEYDSVKAVAYSVGFKSEKVFSRKFIARFGKYPSTYLR